jgi:hypothetical protein
MGDNEVRTAQQILNSVYTGSSLRTVSTDTPGTPATAGNYKDLASSQEIINACYDSTNKQLNLA